MAASWDISPVMGHTGDNVDLGMHSLSCDRSYAVYRWPLSISATSPSNQVHPPRGMCSYLAIAIIVGRSVK
jgi:hypothetical protein